MYKIELSMSVVISGKMVERSRLRTNVMLSPFYGHTAGVYTKGYSLYTDMKPDW